MSAKKPKILMAVLCFLPESVGGSEFYTYHLSQELMKRGYDVTVFASLRDMTLESYKVITVEFEGLKVIKIVNSPIAVRNFTDHFIDARVDEIFRRVLREEKPDLVHFQHIAYLSGGMPEIAKEMKIPSVATFHDYWYMCFRSQLIRPGYGPCPGPSGGVFCASCNDVSTTNPAAVPKFPLINKFFQLPVIRRFDLKKNLPPKMIQKIRLMLYKQPAIQDIDADLEDPHVKETIFRFEFFKKQFLFPEFVMSPSLHLKKRYEDVGYREILHLPLGFYKTEKVASLPFNGKLKIAYLGNLVPFKGAAVVLGELSKMRKREMVEAHFYGRPANEAYFEEVEMLARGFPEGSVIFHGGYRSDRGLKEILSKVHLVVFPSIWEENYPLVVREALLHGLPVLGSSLGGVPEAIQEGVNGFLFDPYKEGDLAGKLELILKNPGILERLAEGARNTRIESMEDHMTKILKIYDDATGIALKGTR